MLPPVIEKSLQHYVAEARKIRKQLESTTHPVEYAELNQRYHNILDEIIDLFEKK